MILFPQQNKLTKLMVVLLLTVTSIKVSYSFIIENGKISSGIPYAGGTTYQHILVEGGKPHTSNIYPPSSWQSSFSNREDYYYDGCYELARTKERIDSRYVRRVLRTKDRQTCEQECDRLIDCRGFNYRYKTLGYNQYRDNCELSSRDDSTRYDFQVDDDFDFYSKVSDSRKCRSSGSYGNNGNNYQLVGSSSGYYGNSNNNYNNNNQIGGSYRDECYRLAEEKKRMERRVVREQIEVRTIGDCENHCTRAQYFTCRSFAFRYGYQGEENCYLSDREYRELSNYELISDHSFDFYERRLYDRECGEGSPDNLIDGGDMTVSGTRCERGRCKASREGGYYYCDTDYAGAWDYCCMPREVCAYSEGSQEKWCYVGVEGRDRWRPCTGQGPGREYLQEDRKDSIILANSSSDARSLLHFASNTSYEEPEYFDAPNDVIGDQKKVQLFDLNAIVGQNNLNKKKP